MRPASAAPVPRNTEPVDCPRCGQRVYPVMVGDRPRFADIPGQVRGSGYYPPGRTHAGWAPLHPKDCTGKATA